MKAQPTKAAVDAEIDKAIREQNHFHSHCTIDNYYGKVSLTRSSTPDEVRAKGREAYAYVRYGSPYKDGNPNGELLYTTDEYKTLV